MVCDRGGTTGHAPILDNSFVVGIRGFWCSGGSDFGLVLLAFGAKAAHRAISMTKGRTPLIRVTAMPADTNPYGGVFGGWLMGQMGLACGSFASRRTNGKAILVAADAIKFPGA